MDDQVSAACGFTTTFLAAGRVLCPRSTQCCSLDSGLPVGGRQLRRFGCEASNGGARDPEAPADLGQTLSTHRKDGRVLVFYLVGSNFRTVDIRQVWVENAVTYVVVFVEFCFSGNNGLCAVLFTCCFAYLWCRAFAWFARA